ncbi:MAG: hypothetical protein ACXWUP_03040 [Allosphingosinicella sp.]
MRRTMIAGWAAALLAGHMAVAQTAPTADPGRTVEFELREGNLLVAKPTLRVQLGRPAAIAAGDYSLRLRMDRAAATDGSGPGPYVIRSQLYRSAGWTLVATPAVTVAEGEQTRMHFSDSDGRDMSLAVMVR